MITNGPIHFKNIFLNFFLKGDLSKFVNFQITTCTYVLCSLFNVERKVIDNLEKLRKLVERTEEEAVVSISKYFANDDY